jgi:hypothetical protein
MSPSTKTVVPTVTGALADNYAALRAERQELQRASIMHERATPEHIEGWWQRVTIARGVIADLEYHQELILASLTAHELTWAHLSGDCLICRGEIRLVNDRPF